MKVYRRQETLDWLLAELRPLGAFRKQDVAPFAHQVRGFESLWQHLKRHYLARVSGRGKMTVWRVRGD